MSAMNQCRTQDVDIYILHQLIDAREKDNH